jgi:hypothetical protein
MRPEQAEAVKATQAYFLSRWAENMNAVPRFLWNAKMRFGKTFTTYQLAKKLGAKRVLVVTFKPAVEDAWQTDLEGHVDFTAGSKGVRQPVWADDDVACIGRGLAPLSIFRPGSAGDASFKAWRDKLRACYTDRYAKTSATRAYADFRALRAAIDGTGDGLDCELFNEAVFRLPNTEEIKVAGWPSRKDRLPRAILATSLRRKAQDFADGAPIGRNNVNARGLDHLYSCGFLGVDRDDPLANRALNCALITSLTNRNKSASPPSKYIEQRAKAANLGEDTVRWRLATHLIPYAGLIADDYQAFLDVRSKLIENDMRALCGGVEPTT